jgi:Short C-terminal domain
MNMPRLLTFAPALPIMTGALNLFNTANARDYFRRDFSHAPNILFWLLFLALLVLAVLYVLQLFRSSQGSSAGTPPVTTPAVISSADSAMQILRERLAKGEIDPEDYEIRRRMLASKEETV